MAELPASVVATYESIARGRKGIAVVVAKDERCSQCQVRLRPQVFVQVRLNSGIVQCDSCQRILYFVPPPAAPAQPAAPATGMITAYIDGGSRGNPGPAGYGVQIVGDDGAVVAELYGSLAHATNNVAEYHGLLAALAWAVDQGQRRCTSARIPSCSSSSSAANTA